MATRHKRENEWKEAKKRCRLNDEEIRMAKELGIGPRSLIKNIPSPSQRWKLPVKEWVRELYYKKFGRRRSPEDSTKKSPALREENDMASDLAAAPAKPPEVDRNDDIEIPF
jgi:hypothetical protein